MKLNYQTVLFAPVQSAIYQIEFTTPSTLAIILASVLGVLLLALIIWLLASKHLTQWARAASQGRKWNAQNRKLSNELKSLARNLNQQHFQLGKETWEARLSDPAYEDAYTKLVNVNQQMLGMEMHASSLNDELKQLQHQRETIESQYDSQLSQVDNERTATQKQLNEMVRKHKELDMQSTELNMEKARVQREIKEAHTSIIEIENSDAPNKSALIFPQTSRLDQLKLNLSEISAKSPSIDDEVMKLEATIRPLNIRLEELSNSFSRTISLKKQELSPLDERISNLTQSIKKKEEEIAHLQGTIPAMLEELGAHVDHVRPETLRLAPLYTTLDDIHDRTKFANEEQLQLRLLMDKADKASTRKFWLFIALAIVILIGIVLILLFV